MISILNLCLENDQSTSGDGCELSGQHMGLLLLGGTEKGSFHIDLGGILMKRHR